MKLNNSYLFFSIVPDTGTILSTLYNLTSSSPQLNPIGTVVTILQESKLGISEVFKFLRDIQNENQCLNLGLSSLLYYIVPKTVPGTL